MNYLKKSSQKTSSQPQPLCVKQKQTNKVITSVSHRGAKTEQSGQKLTVEGVETPALSVEISTTMKKIGCLWVIYIASTACRAAIIATRLHSRGCAIIAKCDGDGSS